MAPDIRYRIEPSRPEAHLFRVDVHIATPDPAGQVFSLPAWIPGSYMIREFARNIVTLQAESAGGPVRVDKVDKHTWRAEPVGGPLLLSYEVYAWDLSVRSAHLDQTHGFFNGTSMFVMVHGKENGPCVVEIAPPAGEQYAGWRVATTMTPDGAVPYGFGAYRASNYDELIDHPVEMGTFTVGSFEAGGVAHDIVLTGRHDADMDSLEQDLARVCEEHIRLFGGTPPFSRYLFLVMVVDDGYGGLEHRASTSLICSRKDLPTLRDRQEGRRSEAYRGFLGLCSHEYFHAWNVKRIKPAAFCPYDLTREVYTTQLWAFEGITSYYDDLALVRAGLMSEDEYLEVLGKTITRVLRGSGRFKQSVAESSFDAWTKFYRQDENAPNAIVSYYTKGALIALALDLTLRLGTGGKVSLDDLMRTLWATFGETGQGVPEGEIERVAAAISGLDLEGFFKQALHGVGDLPLGDLLSEFGIDYVLRQAESADDAGGKRPTSASPPGPVLGARVRGGRDAVLSHVYEGGAAQRAGLSAGDCIIAIDGLRVTGDDAARRIARCPIDAPVTVHAFRRDELMTFSVVPTEPPLDTCHLEKREGSDVQLLRRHDWLQPTQSD